MCGIVGYIGERDSVPVIMDALGRLEYRGYDSAGIAVIDDAGALVGSKAEGKLARLAERLANGEALHGHVGVGHTRWRHTAGPRMKMRILTSTARRSLRSCTTGSSRTTLPCARS
jgi:glucosamine--fructose-6-phosphate aminotransferase (isomerizing)